MKKGSKSAGTKSAGKSAPSLKISDDVLYRTSDARYTVIIDITSNNVFSINPQGSLIWSLIDGAKTATEIASVLSEKFAEQKITKDVTDFLSVLEKEGLIFKTNDPDEQVSSADALDETATSKKWAKPNIKRVSEDAILRVAGGGH